MKNKMMNLLFELLKNSKRSDREIAKVLDVSQPTVTRMRNKLIKEEMIQEWTIIPNFEKMGYQILAITIFKAKYKIELLDKAIKTTMESPNIIFASRAHGMGKNSIVFSIHKNYSCYSNWFADRMTHWEDMVENYDTILISLGGSVVKPFSLKYLAELKEEKTTPLTKRPKTNSSPLLIDFHIKKPLPPL